jgi:hypothetical protein
MSIDSGELSLLVWFAMYVIIHAWVRAVVQSSPGQDAAPPVGDSGCGPSDAIFSGHPAVGGRRLRPGVVMFDDSDLSVLPGVQQRMAHYQVDQNPRILPPGMVLSQFEGYPLPSSRLGSSSSYCAPAATSPKVYAEHYAAHAAACRGYHICSLHELPHTICDPVVPHLVAFYNPW